MRAVVYRFQRELRNRWRSWVGVALLLGAFGGVATAGAAGARRTDSAYPRFMATHQAADLFVDEFIPNPDAATVTHAQVAGTTGVVDAEQVRSFGFEGLAFNGGDPQTTTAALTAEGFTSLQLVATPDGRAYGTGLDRLKVISGRLADPSRPDEVVVGFTFPRARLGDHLDVYFDRALQGDPHQLDQKAGLMKISFTIVGTVAAPGEFPPQTPNNYYSGPTAFATPAFFRAHNGDIAAFEVDLLRRAPGTDETRLEKNLSALSPTGQVPINDLGGQAAEVRRSTRLEALALWLLSGLVGLVGLLVLGYVLSRQSSLEGADTPALRALGMSRAQAFGLNVLRVACIGLAGAAVTVLLAAALSPLAPIGLARTAEPSPGFSLNLAVLGLGGLAVAAGSLLIALGPAWWATAAQVGRPGADHSPGVAGRLASWGASPAMTCGALMALGRGRGRTAVPVRSSVVGAVIGLAALAGAITFGASLASLLRTPALYGVTWDGDILNNAGPDAVPAAVPILQSSKDVESAAYRYAGLDIQLEGSTLTQGEIFVPVKGDLGAAIIDGRAPGDREIALGTRTMDTLHTHIGATLHIVAENPDAAPVAVQVVGRAVLPPGEFVGRLGVGVVINEATLKSASGVAGGFPLRRPYIISVHFRPGVVPADGLKRLTATLAAADPQFLVHPPPVPNDLVNFGRIQNLPYLLAGLLALLATATLAHLLVSSVRRRRRDLAMLKTLGFDRHQVRRTVAWQATILGLISAGIGIPLGVAAGRIAWDALAASLGTIGQPAVPVLLLAAVVPAAILLANAVAAVPAAIAARIRPAVALRAE